MLPLGLGGGLRGWEGLGGQEAESYMEEERTLKTFGDDESIDMRGERRKKRHLNSLFDLPVGQTETRVVDARGVKDTQNCGSIIQLS